MFVTGIVTAVVGIILFHAALGRTVQANAGTRIPFGRSPRTSPRGSIAMRAAGSGLIVLGAVLVSASGWQWTAMIVLAGPLAAFAVLAQHNRRVDRGGDDGGRRGGQ